jgi:hypothetical protein
MGSQNVRAVLQVVAPVLVAACGSPVPSRISSISLREDAPDLSLSEVAFARLAEGRVVARGNADRLDYRRAGARMQAEHGGAIIFPEPSSRLAALGSIRFNAARMDGEIANRRGVASGDVRVDAERGDTGRTERVLYDNDVVRSDVAVAAEGPGYRVHGQGLFARTDGSVIQLTDGVAGQLQMEARR